MEQTREMTKRKKSLLILKRHVTVTRKNAYKSNKLKLQNISLTFTQKSESPFSASSFLSRSLMTYNTTALLDRLTCTD